MRVLLLSAYDALSHRYWREQLTAGFPSFNWTVLALAPRHFSFRTRGNPLSWYSAQREQLAQPFDLVIATSMVDMATLRGLIPSLASVPLWLYCHENQFVYPGSEHQQSEMQRGNRLQAQLVFLYNCLCADAISFNSSYNRDTALAGLAKLLKTFPDKFDASLLTGIQARSDVLPIPLREAASATQKNSRGADGEALQLVWNHRWEYDKGPAHLLAFARLMVQAGPPATLHVVGQQFRARPAAFEALERLLPTQHDEPQQRAKAPEPGAALQRGAWGFIDNSDEYGELLARCDVVVSTALHDFQGLAVLEACLAGCTPLLPDKLVYPEQFDAKWLYAWHDDPQLNAVSMLDALLALDARRRAGEAGPGLQRFSWQALAPRYTQKIESLTGH
ncbi:MAG: DUF3524 domain-containing protein [Pseudomonadales bacterium]|nr:DUF3524 domain-containing protein [Pseudomonadales bacterium]